MSRTDWGAFFWFRRDAASALDAATSIAWCGPSSRSDAKSTAYATDIAVPLAVNGSVRSNAAVTEASAISAANSAGLIEEVGLAEAEHHRHRTRDGHEGDIQAAARGTGAHQCTLGAVETQ